MTCSSSDNTRSWSSPHDHERGWLSEVDITGFGVAQAHLPTTISVDRVIANARARRAATDELIDLLGL